MAPFFKSSQVWVVDFTYDGHPRRWLKALPEGTDGLAELSTLVQELYGRRGKVVAIRLATHDEETDYVQGNLPRNLLCPTGR